MLLWSAMRVGRWRDARRCATESVSAVLLVVLVVVRGWGVGFVLLRACGGVFGLLVLWGCRAFVLRLVVGLRAGAHGVDVGDTGVFRLLRAHAALLGAACCRGGVLLRLLVSWCLCMLRYLRCPHLLICVRLLRLPGLLLRRFRAIGAFALPGEFRLTRVRQCAVGRRRRAGLAAGQAGARLRRAAVDDLPGAVVRLMVRTIVRMLARTIGRVLNRSNAFRLTGPRLGRQGRPRVRRRRMSHRRREIRPLHVVEIGPLLRCLIARPTVVIVVAVVDVHRAVVLPVVDVDVAVVMAVIDIDGAVDVGVVDVAIDHRGAVHDIRMVVVDDRRTPVEVAAARPATP
jgi:hypothetical protein